MGLYELNKFVCGNNKLIVLFHLTIFVGGINTMSLSCSKNFFPAIKLKSRVNEHPSTPIIINAANEVSVDQFINKKLPFLEINKIIMGVLNDKNYKKYAIRNPRSIYQIIKIDQWARETATKLC